MSVQDLDFGNIIIEQDKSMPHRYNVHFIPNNKQPHVCPVCLGKGIVPNGFYLYPHNQWFSSSTSPEKCKSCQGSGVVWDF